MALPVNIHVQPSSLRFDWDIETPNSNIIEREGYFFLIYDPLSAGTDESAWNYSNSDLDEKYPLFTPKQLILDAEIDLLGDVAIASVDVLMSLSRDAATPFFIAEDILIKNIILSGGQTSLRENFSINLGNYFTNKDFAHGEKYKAHVQLVAKDASSNIIGLSTWLETKHFLHVNVVAPLIEIVSPKFLQDTEEDFSYIIVEDKEHVTIELVTTDDCEIRLQKDFSYPDGIGQLTFANSSLVSSSGTKHTLVIENPNPEATNGLRFTLAARDTKYKNISPNGWGRFNYNILFQKKECISPIIFWTQTPETNVSGFYNLDASLSFSGEQTNAGALKLELWQNNQKKIEQVCSINNEQWQGVFSNLSSSGIKEGEVAVKAIATSYTGTIVELLWMGHLLKTPDIFIGQPIQNILISKPDFFVSGHIVNSLSYLDGDGIIVAIYAVNDVGMVEVDRKYVKVGDGGEWTIQMSGLASGVYQLEAVAKNIINLFTTVTRTVTIELLSPSAQILSPTANSFHKEQALAVSGTYSDATSISIEAQQNFEIIGTYSATLIENGTWNANIFDLNHGQIDLKIKISSSVSNLMTVIWHTIFIDIEPPVVYIDQILGKNVDNLETDFALTAEIYAYSNNVLIKTHAEDALSKIVNYSLIINGDLIKTFSPSVPEATLSITESLTLTSQNNTIEILYMDIVGNVGKARILGQDFIKIIYTPYNADGPVLTINSPQNNEQIATSNVEISGICNDIQGTQEIVLEFYRPDESIPYLVDNGAIVTNNLWNVVVSGLEPGINIIKASGIDGLGMPSTSFAEISVLIDSVAPVIHSFDVASVVNVDTCEIVVEASDDDSGLFGYFVEVENELGVRTLVDSVDFEPSILPDTITSISCVVPLTRGINIVSVTFKDLLNNSRTQTQNVVYEILDVSAPTVIVDCDSAFIQLPALFDVIVQDPESGLEDLTVDIYPLVEASEITDDTPFYRLGVLPTTQASLDDDELVDVVPAENKTVLRLLPKTNTEATYLTADLGYNIISNFDIELGVEIKSLSGDMVLASCYNTQNSNTLILKIKESRQIALELTYKDKVYSVASTVTMPNDTLLDIKAMISTDGFAEIFVNNEQIGRGSIYLDDLLIEGLDIGDKNSLSDIIIYKLNFLDKDIGSTSLVGQEYIWEEKYFYDQTKFNASTGSILFSEKSCDIRSSYELSSTTNTFSTEATFPNKLISPEHLVDGKFVLKVCATNTAGLTTMILKEFFIDTLQPNFYFVPSDGKVVSPGFEPQLYFNKTMDTGSVEDNLTILPSLSDGYWEWSDNNKIATYKHISNFLPGAVLAIKLDDRVRDGISGQYIRSSKSAFYIIEEDANFFQVLATIPSIDENDVPLDSTLELFFSHAIKPTGILPNQTVKVINQKTLLVEEMVLDEMDVSQKRFIFRFENKLEPETVYQVTIDKDIESLNGSILGNDNVFDFKTTDIVRPIVEYSFPVFNGINGCSMPLDDAATEHTNISLRNVLEKKLGVGKVGAIYWYDTSKQKWVGDLLGQQVMHTFKWQDGFFVTLNLKTPTKINFIGSVVEHGCIRIDMKKGLNLISIPIDNGVGNIKSLLRDISEQIGQATIVAYMNRRLKLPNRYEELLGYTYVGDMTHGAIDFKMDRLGGDAIAIIAEEDCSFLIQGDAWQD